jgi:hypothetical protein
MVDDSVVMIRVEPRAPALMMVMFQNEKGAQDSSSLHSAKLGGVKVANMQTDFRPGDEEWHVARVRLLDPDVFRLDILFASIPDSLDGKPRKKAIEEAVRKEGSFSGAFLCIRK